MLLYQQGIKIIFLFQLFLIKVKLYRVSVSSTVEAVINKLKLKLPDEVDTWKLFYDGKCLDDPAVTLNSIEKIGNLIGANKNLEVTYIFCAFLR